MIVEFGPIAAAIAVMAADFVWLVAEIPGLARYSALLTVTAVGGSLALVAPLPLLPRACRLAIAFVLIFAAATFVLADAVHIRFFGDGISLTEFSYAHQLTGVLSSVLRLLELRDLLYYAPVIAAAAAAPFYSRLACRVPDVGVKVRTMSALVFLCVGLLFFATTGRALARNPEIYTAFTEYVEMQPGPEVFGPLQVERVSVYLRRHNTGAAKSSVSGAARGRNVILISAESLNAFPIELKIHGQPVMPNLASLAHESLYFENFYDETGRGGTSDAEFVALQSIHPPRSGAVAYRYAANHFRAMPELLAEHGYATMSACGASADFWNMASMHRALGFRTSYFERDYQVRERINGWMSDSDFFAQTVRLFETQPRPFMAFLLTSSNHHPFIVPPGERALQLGPLEGTPLGNYLQSVAYFDRALGAFLRDLRRVGLLDTSIIALYGDHHGYRGDRRPLHDLLGIAADGRLASWSVDSRVPFLVRLPRARHAGIIRKAGGHVDIAPTILSLVGIRPTSVMLGRDLTGPDPGLAVQANGTVTDGTSYLLQGDGPQCFRDSGGARIPCRELEELRRSALDELQTSAFIIQGDLIPRVEASVAPSTRSPALH